jgi:hypothetical protein
MSEITIHIGSHKTGSTAIQKTLSENRVYLRDVGYDYPEIGFTYYGHHALQALLEGDGSAISAVASDLKKIEKKIIISSENFSRSSPKGVARLGNIVRTLGLQPRIIYYQRNILDITYVWWQELVKHGLEKTFLEYYGICLTRPFSQHILSPHTTLNRWADAFGRDAISIFIYDQIQDTAAHFFEQVLDLEGYQIKPDTVGINKSFDVPSTELIRCFNMFGHRGVDLVLKDPETQKLRSELRSASQDKMTELQVDFDCFLFKTIEREFADNWRDRIEGTSIGEPIFSKRSTNLRFIDSSFWMSQWQLSAKIEAYASTLSSKS